MPNESDVTGIANRMGFRGVPEVLSAADMPIRRGHHLAIAAGRGAGVEAVYALAVEMDCDPETGLQALILVPTRDRAAEVVLAVQRAVGAASLRTGAARPRPDGTLDTGAIDVHCLVARPSLLLPEIRLGRLSLSDLRLLILDGVADLEDLDEWASVEPLLDSVGSEVKRVAVSRRVDDEFLELVQRQLPRGRRWPEGLFEEGKAPDPAEGGFPDRIAVGLGASEEERLSILVEALAERPGAIVRCRSESSIPTVRAALESVGLEVGVADGDGDLVTRTRESGRVGEPALAWFGLPLTLDALTGGAGRHAVAIVDPAHWPQLEILARRAGTSLQLIPGTLPTAGLDPLGRYRAQVRARIERGGTDAELLVLEPLVREFGTTRVATALSDLLRRSGGGDPTLRPWADVEAASRRGEPARPARTSVADRAAGGSAVAHPGTRGSWSRVFIGAGNRDSVRVGDLVGAITGETGIAGAQIGKIEIRGSFSLVEIDSQVVDRVIEKLNGTSIRGREVAVKPDRGG